MLILVLYPNLLNVSKGYKKSTLQMLGAIFGKCGEYMKLDRDKSTFKSHRDFSSEIEITFKHF